MSIQGSITVNYNGFINYLDTEMNRQIQQLIYELQKKNRELQILLSRDTNIPRLSNLYGCCGYLSRCWKSRQDTNNTTNTTNTTNNNNINNGNNAAPKSVSSMILELDELIRVINSELCLLSKRKEYIWKDDFKNSILGQCPVCLDELINKSETTIITDCLHPICKSCFDRIYKLKNKYKCPICCSSINNTFYEVWFWKTPHFNDFKPSLAS